MTPLHFQLLCGLLVLLGLSLAFAGHRVFRVCLGVLGFAGGLAVGLWVAGDVHLAGVARVLVVLGIGLFGAVAAAAVYHVGVFVLGALALAGAAGSAGVAIEQPMGIWVLGGAGLLGGLLALALHRRVLVAVTGLAGALATVAGLAPLVRRARPPVRVDVPWLREQILALPRWWLAVAGGVFLLGSLTQLAALRGRRGGILLAASTSLDLAPDVPQAPRAPRGARSGEGGRSHGAICPRCGSVVDVDALFCDVCGNDQWE